jgi:predicted SAM-dependent methyltransferase
MVQFLRPLARAFFRDWTRSDVRFELLRMRARWRHYSEEVVPPWPKLHFGCGSRRVPGWFNIDVKGSDYDVDLACGHLPIASQVFDAAVGQQVIEHLQLESELMPLMHELHRVMKPGGELYLSTPDMETICRLYMEGKSAELIDDRITRDGEWQLGTVPAQHMINEYFHQSSQHKNLFDFGLLEWVLQETGFAQIERIAEAQLLARFPEFPPRHDDFSTLYVRARAE